MRVAVALSQGHVCSRLDCADQILLIEIQDGAERNRDTVDLHGWPAHGRSTRIARMGVGRLICGAVSHFDEAGLSDSGVELIAGVTGPAEAVVAAVVSETIVPKGDYWQARAIHQ